MSDLIRRQDAIGAIAKRIYHIEDGNENDELRKAICDIDALPSVNAIPYDSTVTLNSPTIIKATSTDLISRQAAIKNAHFPVIDDAGYEVVRVDDILALPSADRPTTDCTEFMEWLKAEVLDENNWELNAVAYGEIICRKLKKLGWIDVEDGFYVDTRPTGKWVEVEDYNGDIHYQCNQCKNEFILIDGTPKDNDYKYCPNCGARMLGEDGEA